MRNNGNEHGCKSQLKKKRKDRPSCAWFLLCTLILSSISLAILLTASLIPSVDTGSEFLRKMFKRGDTYNTTYFSFGNIIFYIVMNIIGFLYVNLSNMNYSRKSVLFSNHESRKDFVMTIFLSPIFYFIGNNVALRSENCISSIAG